MQTMLRVNTRVLAGNKLEIVSPDLPEGEEVTVVVTRVGNTAPETLQATPPGARGELARRLFEQGAIAAIPTGRDGPSSPAIVVRGRPVSETIIEERG